MLMLIYVFLRVRMYCFMSECHLSVWATQTFLLCVRESLPLKLKVDI
jgi:hypothetical protein